MLISLALTNFKKHRNLKLDFTEGLNVVKGPNFCGKSTLLKAVAVALYGIKGAGTKARIATTGETKWKLELCLKLSGKVFTVIRSGSTAKVLDSDGQVVANGSTPVTNWVTENAGADLDDFLTHTYSKQMETSTLLTMGTVKLQHKVEKLSNVSVVDKILELVSARTSKANGQLELLAEVDVKAAKELRDQNNLAVNAMQSKITEGTKDYDSRSQYFDSLNEDYQKQVMTGESVLLLNTQIDSTESLLQDVNTESGELTTLLLNVPKASAKLLEEKSAKLTEIRNHVIHGQSDVTNKTKISAQCQSLEDWLNNTGRPNLILEEKLDPEIESKEGQLATAESAIAPSMAAILVVQNDINMLEVAESDSICPTCKRVYEDAETFDSEGQMKVYTENLANLNLTLVMARKNTDVMRIQLDELLDQYPGEGHAQIIKDTEAKLEKAQSTLYTMADIITPEALEEERLSIAPLEAEVSSLQNQVKEHDRISDKVSTLAKLAVEYSNNLINFKSELAGLDKPTIDLESTKATLVILEQELTSLDDYNIQMSHEHQSLKTDLALAQQTLDLAENTKLKFNKLTGQVGLYKKLSDYLRTSRSRFLKTVWDGILSRATEIVSNATAGHDDQITQIGRDDKGNFFYCEKGEEFGMGDASGCQMEMMGVSLRLALCDCFYGNGSYMMLDEASSQMNNENAAALAGVLAATGKQIIYVTHRETEETAAKNVITLEAA